MNAVDIRAVMLAAMDSEGMRRELASQAPGAGALVTLPDVPYGPGVGISDLPLPPVGESHQQAASAAPQLKSYGPPVPVYAPDVIGGPGYAPGDIQTALRAAGERVAAVQNTAVVVMSPAAAPGSVMGRLLAALRRRASR
jgi:hypothetical protein